MQVVEQAKSAKKASAKLALLNRKEKDAILLAMANALEENMAPILSANQKDIESAEKQGRKAFIDRLQLTEERIQSMADGLKDLMQLQDPTEIVDFTTTRPNGLLIEKRRVPLGLVGIIYEARPNVTTDAMGICIKSGNACILRGGSEAIESNIAIAEVVLKAAYDAGLPKDSVQLITNTSREVANKMMQLNEYIDVLIPRGGKGLIQNIKANATIPVIETGTGNCHIYVDESAKDQMAVDIVYNAKVSRPSVCNAAETLLIHENVAEKLLPLIFTPLMNRNVEIRGCNKTVHLMPGIFPATEKDFQTEYNDLILAVKIVENIEEAISHINHYGTKHSEAIVTENIAHANQFFKEVDASSVYHNASTRFTDGFEFGLGAEIGISTQKLHARGPMGLYEMTSYKYVILGDGQIRK